MGEKGWSRGIPAHPTVNQQAAQAEHDGEEASDRNVKGEGDEHNLHVYARKVYHVFLVDAYAKVESHRLRWLKFHQDTIRAEVYGGLQDHVLAGDGNRGQVARQIVLPSSFAGGPRHMHQLYQDAMAIVRGLHKPDLFITMTCILEWPEIQRELRKEGSVKLEEANDGPDLINRVFMMKLKALVDDIRTNWVFGKVVGRHHSHCQISEAWFAACAHLGHFAP